MELKLKEIEPQDVFISGETALQNAPQIRLKNGRSCIPQHYLTYNHNKSSVEAILSDIDYDPRYLLFVSEDGSVPYIQVGIIGYDNYKPETKQLGQKIVFGRRWRVEPNLPTSEIIQTAFLAIKKAREHEIREVFKVSWTDYTSTPFNSHHDLPLLARNPDLIKSVSSKRTLSEAIKAIRYEGISFSLLNIEKRRSDQWMIDLQYETEILTLLLSQPSEDTLLYTLMEELIRRSDRHVDETFTYKGFARFSRQNNVASIAEMSVSARSRKSSSACINAHFDENLAQEKYDTDSSRVPQLSNSEYSNKLRKQLSRLTIVAGFQPK